MGSIQTVEGNLFDAVAEVFVNPVNCQGVMSKGIAKEFKQRYPAMFAEYQEFCKRGDLYPGWVHVWDSQIVNPCYIFNLATKDQWRASSQMKWVLSGIHKSMEMMNHLHLKTIAMPALGCGEGHLNWDVVQSAIYASTTMYRRDYDIDILLYKPLDRG